MDRKCRDFGGPRLWVALFFLAVMAACGGGGGGGGGEEGDVTPPTVSSVNPINGATEVARTSAVVAAFSEAMDPATINATTFTVSSGGISLPGTVTADGTVATFTPSADLALDASCVAKITKGALDLAGNPLGEDYTWSFNTEVTPWTGSIQFGTGVNDEASGVVLDGSGNIFVAGFTLGGLDGNLSEGNADLFLIKYDPFGIKQWSRQLGTTASDKALGTAVDGGGNAYVAGSTFGSLDGNLSAGNADLFLVKYDASGTKQWTRQLGTAGDDIANGVAVAAGGDIYVAGGTQGSLDGNLSAGSTDLFLTKYDATGLKQWTRQFGSAASDEAFGVAVDGSGNAYVAGSTFGSLDGNSSAGGFDLFLTKYDAAGVKQWTRQFGTTASDEALGVAVDGSGSAFVAGSTFGSLDGNPSAGNADLFVIKYDASGIKQWTRQFGTAANDEAFGVAVDDSGSPYVAGSTFGSLNGNLSAGSADLFVIKYDATGLKQWTRQLGTVASDEAFSVAVSPLLKGGNVFAAGRTGGGLDGNVSAGGFDLFLVKYDPLGTRQ